MKTITQKQIISQLKKVNDPELGISIYDLGLIYKIGIKDTTVKITMTLTSVACPLYPVIEQDIINKVKSIKGEKKVDIKVTFEPAWSIDKMTKTGKTMLGL
jgi:metal-sulfur cluster biosynthetic enzyme